MARLLRHDGSMPTTLTLGSILQSAAIDPAAALVMRHVYIKEPTGSDTRGIHADSSDDEILMYTARQSVSRFPVQCH